MAAYRRDPRKFGGVLGVVETGTRVKALDLVLTKHPESGNKVWPYLEVLDGPWAGKKVSGREISRSPWGAETWVDGHYLKEETK